jgi:hypothetical protein
LVSAEASKSPRFRSLKDLVNRLPDIQTGLDFWDQRLLAACSEAPVHASRLVAEMIVAGKDTRDPIDDHWLLSRLLEMSNPGLPQPLLFRNGPGEIRNTQFSLTISGKRALSGEKSAVSMNGIDRWVGGTRLSSAQGSVLWRSGDKFLGQRTV